jgi:hypothetical protein
MAALLFYDCLLYLELWEKLSDARTFTAVPATLMPMESKWSIIKQSS